MIDKTIKKNDNLLSSKQVSKQARHEWIDFVKGIAILLVMWGHVQKDSIILNWVGTFHVPTFLVITGYLYSEKSSIYSITKYKKILNRVLIPYIWFSLFAICIYYLNKARVAGFSSKETIDFVIDFIERFLTGYGILALWFLPSYLIGSYVFFKISAKTEQSVSYVSGKEVFYYLSIAIIYNYFGFFALEDINSSYGIIVNYLAIAIIRGAACSIYIFVGKLFSLSLNNKECRNKFDKLHLPLGLILLILSFVVSWLIGKNNFSTIDNGRYPLLLFLAGCLGSVGLLSVFFKIRIYKSMRFITFCGKNSLILMSTHLTFLLTSLSTKLCALMVGYQPIEGSAGFLFGVLCVIIMLLLEIPIVYLFNHKLKFMIGK